MIRYNEWWAWFVVSISRILPPIDLGARLRGHLYKPFFKSCGKGVMIPLRTHIFNPNRLSVGNNVYLGYCSYYGQGDIYIGDEVLIGPFVSITATNHLRDQKGSFRNKKLEEKSVRIMNKCWIGAHVSILAGVTIGEGCLIAAGSVVTKDIPNYVLAAGVPAKIIRSIKELPREDRNNDSAVQ